MPFDGNGNWTSNFSAEADRDAGYKILASRFDNIFIADIAAGLSNCVTRDGQGIMQTNTNANNYRVINVADPEDDKDAVNLETVNTKDALCVHLAGEETITGDKTFSGDCTFSGGVSFTDSDTMASIVGLCVPDYTSGVSITTPFTPTKDGIVTLKCKKGNPVLQISYNGTQISRVAIADGTESTNTIWAVVHKGQEYELTTNGGTTERTFYPFIGA